MFLSAKVLLNMLANNDNLVLFDCPFILGEPIGARQLYNKGHIPGAYFVDLDKDLCAAEGPGNHPFQDPAIFRHFLEKHGVSSYSDVVVYDRADLATPARFYCQARELGLENVRILAGGLPAYIAAGGKLSQKEPPLPARSGLLPEPNPSSFRVYLEDVLNSMRDPDTLLIDSRSKKRYLALEEPLYPIAGHIPTAVSYDYQAVQENAFLKNKNELYQYFSGLEKFREIYLSCGSGVSACVNSLALESIGITHKLYNGSYSEWISDPNRPIETIERDLKHVTLED